MLGWYRVLMQIVFAAIYPVARWKAIGGSVQWQDRLGLRELESQVDLWLHAASVGEVRVLSILVTRLAVRHPDLKMHVTTVTGTGFQTAMKLLGDKATVSYFPMDVGSVMSRVYDNLEPKTLVIAETEIWPALICEAERRSIPVVLVNGRMSQSAFTRYRRVSGSLRRLLRAYRRLFVKSDEDAIRWRKFAADDIVEVVGDMKFDAPLPERDPVAIQEQRLALEVGPDDFLLVAGSTRDGEEALLADVHSRCREQNVRIVTVVAPRHVERARQVHEVLTQAGLTVRLIDEPVTGAEVVLVDKMGMLTELYMAADLAFVGGTLVDKGGHNILEPVWAGTPTVYGPSLSNVEEAAAYIESNDYGCRVESARDIDRLIVAMVSGEKRFAAKSNADMSRSTTDRIATYLLELVS